MTVLTSNHLPRKVDMAANNPFIEYYENQALGKQQQIDLGFYIGLPWQNGYGIGGLLGPIARQFILLLKPLVKAAGKRLLHAGASFVSDAIDRKPVCVTARTALKKFNEIRNKKHRHNNPAIIPKKCRWSKHNIFS